MTARKVFVPIADRKNRDLTDAALQVKVSKGVTVTHAEDKTDGKT